MDEERVVKSQGSYAHLMQGLTKQYPSLGENGDSKLFQFMATAREATWTDRMDYNLYQLMNTVPAERGGYYIPSDKQVSSSYASLLNSLCDVNLKKSQKYNELSAAIQTLGNQMSAMMSEDLKKAYMETTGKSFSASEFQVWLGTLNLNSPFLNPTVAQYLEVFNKHKGLKEEQNDLKQRLTRDYRNALAALEDPKNQASIIREGQNEPVQVPHVTLSGKLASDVSRWEASDKNSVTIQINSKDTLEGPTSKVYTSAIHKIGWWANAVHAGEITQQIADEEYELDIDIKGINTYDIQRDKWYNGQYVNPGIAIDDSAILNKESYFGPGGSLQLIPVSFLVIYKPSIRLTIHRDVYEKKIKNFLNVNPFLSFFGWGFNGGASVEKKVIEKDKTIVIPFDAPSTAAPQIIGVTSIKKYL